MSRFGDMRAIGIEPQGGLEGYDHDITLSKRNDLTCAFPVMEDKISLDATVGLGVTMASWTNPYAGDILVLDVILDITTPATGAATGQVGHGVSATAEYDNIIDGVDIGTAAIFTSGAVDPGTNGGPNRKVAEDHFVNVESPADPAGLVGTMRVIWVPLP